MTRSITHPTAAAIAAIAAAGAAGAGTLSLAWSTIDTGGTTTSQGGAYALMGSIGQHDATLGPAAGAGFETFGGFWGPAPEPEPCTADLAPPFGVLDLGDINAFVGGFIAQDPIADLDMNGVFDLSDINTFVAAFTAGCP
jgi:hypothetical protein